MQDKESIVTQNYKTFFTMTQNGIIAFTQDGAILSTSQPVPNKNGLLKFKRGVANLPNPPAEIYCDMVSCELRISRSMRESKFETHQPTQNTYGHDAYPFTLGVNGGDGDHFSLCQSRTSDDTLVVYNVSEGGPESPDFDPTTCTSVFLNIIPESG